MRIGEIDIIAKTGNKYLVFVEVKYRASAAKGNPPKPSAETVDNITRLHHVLLKNHLPEDYTCRFDNVVGMTPTETVLLRMLSILFLINMVQVQKCF